MSALRIIRKLLHVREHADRVSRPAVSILLGCRWGTPPPIAPFVLATLAVALAAVLSAPFVAASFAGAKPRSVASNKK